MCQRLCSQYKCDQKDHDNSAKDWLKGIRKQLGEFSSFSVALLSLLLTELDSSCRTVGFPHQWFGWRVCHFHCKESDSTLIFPQLITSLQEVKLQGASGVCGFLSFVPGKNKRTGLRVTEPFSGNGHCDPLTSETAKVIELCLFSAQNRGSAVISLCHSPLAVSGQPHNYQITTSMPGWGIVTGRNQLQTKLSCKLIWEALSVAGKSFINLLHFWEFGRIGCREGKICARAILIW